MERALWYSNSPHVSAFIAVTLQLGEGEGHFTTQGVVTCYKGEKNLTYIPQLVEMQGQSQDFHIAAVSWEEERVLPQHLCRVPTQTKSHRHGLWKGNV